ncbi:membrane protein [Mycobacterium phage ScoobyDoobyDoo]|nr:membrane protein [Mycobacterium phage ScoobyDoobyDoo]
MTRRYLTEAVSVATLATSVGYIVAYLMKCQVIREAMAKKMEMLRYTRPCQ